MSRGDHLLFAVILALCVFAPRSSAAYSWRPDQGAGDWIPYNVRAVDRAEGLVFRAGADARGLSISIPSMEFAGVRWVRLRVRTIDTLVSVVCVIGSGVADIAHTEKNLTSGRLWRDYVFEFDPLRTAESDRLTFVFKNVHTVEIDAVDTGTGPLTDLFYTRKLRHSSVNFVLPYRLGGYPLTIVLSLLIAVAVAGIAVLMPRQRGRLLYVTFLLFVVCFVLYDLRTDVNAARNVKTVITDFLAAPPGEKRLLWYGDMIEFAAFAKRVIPPTADRINYIGDKERYLFFKYYLFPLEVVREAGKLEDCNIFYGPEDVHLEAGRLIVDGRPLPSGGKMLTFNHQAFIYIQP